MEPMQKEEGGIGCCQRALAHPPVNDQRLADKKQHQRGNPLGHEQSTLFVGHFECELFDVWVHSRA